MSSVSTRNYERVIAEMADTVGVNKSSVSRNFIEQSGRELKRLEDRVDRGIDPATPVSVRHRRIESFKSCKSAV